jgi:hypothetical protein|nr:MAG TPA: hypothetical protein [Caudoviricetes sp.]
MLGVKAMVDGELKSPDIDSIRLSVMALAASRVIREQDGIMIFDQELFGQLYGKDVK